MSNNLFLSHPTPRVFLWRHRWGREFCSEECSRQHPSRGWCWRMARAEGSDCQEGWASGVSSPELPRTGGNKIIMTFPWERCPCVSVSCRNWTGHAGKNNNKKFLCSALQMRKLLKSASGMVLNTNVQSEKKENDCWHTDLRQTVKWWDCLFPGLQQSFARIFPFFTFCFSLRTW